MGVPIMGAGARMVVFSWVRVVEGGRVRVRDGEARMRRVIARMREWRGRFIVVTVFFFFLEERGR